VLSKKLVLSKGGFRLMKKLSVLFLIMLLALSLTLTGCGGGEKPAGEEPSTEEPAADQTASNEVIELKFGHVVQTTHPVHESAVYFADKVKEFTNGRIQIKIFPARQLGDDISLFQQVQEGALDMACPSAAPLASFTNVATAFQMPFLGNDYDLNAKLYASDEFQTLLSGFDEVNVKAFGAFQGGRRHIVGTKGFLKTPADMKGVKIRVAETPLLIDMFKALGASPTPMPYGEIYTGLQNQIIDAVEMDITALLVEKHYEVAKYVTKDAHYVWPMIVMMSVNKWNSLSPEDQDAIKRAYAETITWDAENLKKRDTEAEEELKAKGVQFYEPNAEEVKALNEASATVIQKYCDANQKVADFVKYAQSVKAGQ